MPRPAQGWGHAIPLRHNVPPMRLSRWPWLLPRNRSLPKASQENPTPASRERRYVIPRPQRDPALSDPGRRSGYTPGQDQRSTNHQQSIATQTLATTTGLLANARTPLYYDIRETHKENMRCNSSTSLVVSPKLRPQLKLTDDDQPNDEQPSCGEIPLYAETNAHNSLARTQQHPTPA